MFTLELKDEDLVAALARLQGGMDDMTEVTSEIGEFLAESHQQRIERTLGAPDGTAWAAKSPFTRSKDPRPLYDSGEMSRNINSEPGKHSVEIIATGVQVRTMHYGAAKGAFGQTGKGRPIPYGDIPARPFMGISESDEAGIAEALQEWVDRLAEGH
ncbi:MAG: phage virion morphogenesis protein [Pseudodonghicola sp.]